jgi:type IV pilus assembly protein PilX
MTPTLVSQPLTTASGVHMQRSHNLLPVYQRGVVLFIAMIVLVAMTMAGIAIMRSVDTGNLISGNLAFKQGTLQGGDYAVNGAVTYLLAQEFTGALNNSNPGAGYMAIGYNGTTEPNWTTDAAWASAVTVGTDATGNTAQYLINRLCDTQGAPNAVNCARIQKVGGEAGNSQGYGGAQFNNTPMIIYRVTTRITGPRGSSSIIQFDIALQH